MKVIKLTEKIKNLDKVVTNDHINAVTEMPPAMSDAYEDSIEKDAFDEKILKDEDALPKDQPFIGASKQPLPKKPEEAKINLEESLFEAMGSRSAIYDDLVDYINDKLTDCFDNISMEVMDVIPDYNADWCRADFNPQTGDKQLMFARAVADDLMSDCDLVESLNESSNGVLIGTMTLDKEIPGWTNYAEFANYDEEVTALPSSSPVKIYPQGSSLGHSFYWSFDAVDKNGNNTKANGDAYLYDLGRFLDGSRGMTLKLDPNWSYTGKYPYLVRTEESVEDYSESLKEAEEILNEDGRSQSKLRQYDDTDIEEEELDLWTLVYSSLIDKPDEATWKAMQKFDTVVLPKKMRYDVINTDADGNIVVYGETEKMLDGAKLVADLYELEYEIKPARESWAKVHPEQAFSLTIKIPEEEVTDIDKYFKK